MLLEQIDERLLKIAKEADQDLKRIYEDIDKTALINKFLYGGTANVSGNVLLNDPTKEKESGIYYKLV